MNDKKINKYSALDEKLGLVGRDISYSLSPRIHNFSAKLLGISDRYEIFDLEPHELEPFVGEFLNSSGRGFNVTKPYKQAVSKILDGKEDSVNTVFRKDGRWQKMSTDGIGFEKALLHEEQDLKSFSRVVFLGSGGATLAIAQQLRNLDYAGEVFFVRRSTTNDMQIKDLLIQSKFLEFDPKQFLHISGSSGSTLLIQATSLPLQGNSLSPFVKGLKPFEGCVAELTYNADSAFLDFARHHKIPHQDGIPMLIEQARAAQKLWWNEAAPYQEILGEICKS